MYCQESVELTRDTCYELSKEVCGPININPGLTPADSYYLQIIDKFVTRYTQQVVIKDDGSFDVDTTLLPDGYFNQYAGKFELYLSTSSEGTDYIDMTFEEEVYKCVILSIVKIENSDCC